MQTKRTPLFHKLLAAATLASALLVSNVSSAAAATEVVVPPGTMLAAEVVNGLLVSVKDSPLAGCLVNADSESDFITERIYVQPKKISCVFNGKTVSAELHGYLVDARDKRVGLKVNVLSPEGEAPYLEPPVGLKAILVITKTLFLNSPPLEIDKAPSLK